MRYARADLLIFPNARHQTQQRRRITTNPKLIKKLHELREQQTSQKNGPKREQLAAQTRKEIRKHELEARPLHIVFHNCRGNIKNKVGKKTKFARRFLKENTIVCFQETKKRNEKEIPQVKTHVAYWIPCFGKESKNGRSSGMAMYIPKKSAHRGMSMDRHNIDDKRSWQTWDIIQMELCVMNIYVHPEAKENEDIIHKTAREIRSQIDLKKQMGLAMIIGGDFNAHPPNENHNKTLNWNTVVHGVIRRHGGRIVTNTHKQTYTSAKGNQYTIDYIAIIDNQNRLKINKVTTHEETFGSDHQPLSIVVTARKKSKEQPGVGIALPKQRCLWKYTPVTCAITAREIVMRSKHLRQFIQRTVSQKSLTAATTYAKRQALSNKIQKEWNKVVTAAMKYAGMLKYKKGRRRGAGNKDVRVNDEYADALQKRLEEARNDLICASASREVETAREKMKKTYAEWNAFIDKEITREKQRQTEERIQQINKAQEEDDPKYWKWLNVKQRFEVSQIKKANGQMAVGEVAIAIEAARHFRALFTAKCDGASHRRNQEVDAEGVHTRNRKWMAGKVNPLQFSAEDVGNALKKIKSSRGVSWDGEPIGLYKALMKTAEGTAVAMAYVNAVAAIGVLPSERKVLRIQTLLKKDNPETFADIRGIGICPSFTAIFQKTLFARVKKEMWRAIHPAQGGGRPGNNCIIQNAALRAALGELTGTAFGAREGRRILILVVDKAKAYDSVDIQLILKELKDGMKSKWNWSEEAWELQRELISDNLVFVQWKGWTADPHIQTRGMTQGNGPSGTFYGVMFDSTVRTVIRNGQHIRVFGIVVSIWCWVDDAICLCDTISDIRRTLSLIRGELKRNSMKLNSTKCAMVPWREQHHERTEKDIRELSAPRKAVKCGPKALAIETRVKILGEKFDVLDQGTAWVVTERIAALKGLRISAYVDGIIGGKTAVTTQLNFFNAVARGIAKYGLHLRYIEDKTFTALNQEEYRFLTKIIGVSQKDSENVVRWITGIEPMSLHIKRATMMEWHRIQHADSTNRGAALCKAQWKRHVKKVVKCIEADDSVHRQRALIQYQRSFAGYSYLAIIVAYRDLEAYVDIAKIPKAKKRWRKIIENALIKPYWEKVRAKIGERENWWLKWSRRKLTKRRRSVMTKQGHLRPVTKVTNLTSEELGPILQLTAQCAGWIHSITQIKSGENGKICPLCGDAVKSITEHLRSECSEGGNTEEWDIGWSATRTAMVARERKRWIMERLKKQ